MTTRDDALGRLSGETFDLLVIGGGITGAGVALDAATRGMRVALVERDDFASGTSSRSSKLVHGGLRYLQHLELGLVREALTERGILQRMAPFLVSPIRFVVPRYGKRRLLAIRAGLEVYDALAIGSGFPRNKRVEPDDVTRLAPALQDGSKGGLLYWDARTDDARLTWTVGRTAIEHGTAAANHAKAVALLRSGDRVAGATVEADGSTFDVRADAVVNACGVWADDVARMEDTDGAAGIRPSKGIHVVFAADRVPVRCALTIPAPDGRYIFVIPWPEDGVVIVGTTDEDYTGDPDHPRAEPDEIAFLIDTLNRVLREPVKADDLVSSYAGLRPLIAKPGEASKDLSRRHRVQLGSGGVVTITGGKLTTYRAMAADAVDAALESGRFRQRPRSTTASVHLSGGQEPPGLADAVAARAGELGLDQIELHRLWLRYGARVPEVLDVAEEAPGRLPGTPYLLAEALYAVRTEMARTVDDVLSRRLRARITAPDRGIGALGSIDLPGADGYRDDVRADLDAERG